MAKVSSTQENVPIAGIHDGIIILKSGQYRLILEVSPINFALKSEQEQNALIFQYQSFLNSLHFPIQIVIQSKRLDLSPYINKIKKLADKQPNDLLEIQTKDYIDFVSQLINIANIMKKRFYVVVGYQPLQVSTGLFNKLFDRSSQITEIKISDQEFEHHSKELRQRGNQTASNLGSMGMHCRQLSTQDIIETFYSLYNPEVSGKERLTKTDELSSTLVTSTPKETSKEELDQISKEEKYVEKADSIDNTAQVQAKQKKEQQIRQQEMEKTGERQIRQSPTEKTAPAPQSSKQADQTKQTDKSPDHTLSQIENVAYSSQMNSNKKQPKIVTPQELANGDKAEAKVVSDPNLNKDYGW